MLASNELLAGMMPRLELPDARQIRFVRNLGKDFVGDVVLVVAVAVAVAVEILVR